MDNLDPKNVFGSTEMFALQCKQIWEEAKKLEFPSEYQNIENIIVCGMGGSAYGGYIISSLFKDKLKVPIVSNNDYTIPAFAGENTLVVLSSYSGSTEEVLSCAQKAKEAGCKLTALTGGGKLEEFLKDAGAPALIFEPKHNPSGQPRLGTGYMVLGMIALLNRSGILSVSDKEVAKAISELETDTENIKSKAKEMSEKIKGFIPVIFSAEFLGGNNHIIRNQFNETSKSFSAFAPLPELNHHLLEGFKNPEDKKLFVLFISSDLYSDKLKKRVELTKDVIEKNNVSFDEYKPAGSSKLAQMLNTLAFGGYLTLYLAFSYGLDPSLIPWVDYFKAQMEK